MPLLTTDILRNAFLDAIGVSDLNQVRESILIREGVYCGRQWTANQYSLIWFCEESQVKLFGPGRHLLFSGSAEMFVAGGRESKRAA
jgi:hypothetical protein